MRVRLLRGKLYALLQHEADRSKAPVWHGDEMATGWGFGYDQAIEDVLSILDRRHKK